MEQNILNVMKGKRGVSSVISTVLLVLIVIAAIGILAVAINNFVKGSTDDIGSSVDCLELQIEITSAEMSGNNALVKVKRIAGEGEIDDLKFLINGNSKDASGEIPNVGETKTFTLTGITGTNTKVVEVIPIVGAQTCSGDTATIESS